MLEKGSNELKVVFENAHILVVDKPGGMSVEKSNYGFKTVETLVDQYLSQNYSNPYIGITHRLDRVTSGLLIIAKRKSALRLLNEQFRNRSVKKNYLAILERKPKFSAGNLEHWLRKDQKNKRAIIYGESQENASQVELFYQVLGQVKQGYLVQVKPSTGKYHQIRAQFSAIDCPILGDFHYHAKMPFGENQIALHAWKLDFIEPKTKQTLQLEVPKWLDQILD